MSNGKFPAFSVLMTVYEKEKPLFLDQALKSIENQTVKPHEIVIVKDGPLPVDLDEVLQNHEKSFVHV
ncbi:glycosyltransferase [Limosilactobacillus fermentum]